MKFMLFMFAVDDDDEVAVRGGDSPSWTTSATAGSGCCELEDSIQKSRSSSGFGFALSAGEHCVNIKFSAL